MDQGPRSLGENRRAQVGVQRDFAFASYIRCHNTISFPVLKVHRKDGRLRFAPLCRLDLNLLPTIFLLLGWAGSKSSLNIIPPRKHALTLQLHTAHILSAHATLDSKSKAIQDIREQKNKYVSAAHPSMNPLNTFCRLDSERARLLNALREV